MSFDWSASLRAELTKRAEMYGPKIGAPSYVSLGETPTRLFEPYDLGVRHGNFIDASYKAICSNEAWRARTRKPHSQVHALPSEKRLSAKELDSCNSSDALLMNCFCYPGAAERVVTTLLPSVKYAGPEFAVHGEVALVGGARDTTEIDMRIGSGIFEAKLTERDFTSKLKSHVERYVGFAEVFEVGALPQSSDNYHGYQLVRNVLAADQQGCAFYVICDARRPDLLHEWWAVHSAIRDMTLRTRCGFLLWQEVVRACPTELADFLAVKYGLGNALGDEPLQRPH